MATVYRECDSEVTDLAARLIVKHFADIQELETRIGWYFAECPANDDGEKPPAVKENGFPALGTLKITSYAARVAGHPDLIAWIDFDQWEAMQGREREALVYRLLYSVILKRDKDGTAQSDDMGRPKFRKRKPDFAVVGYFGVAKGYGVESPEVKAFADLQTWMQSELAFG